MHDDDEYDPNEYNLIPDPRTILRQGCTVKLDNDLFFRSVVITVNYFLDQDFAALQKMSGKRRSRHAALFLRGQENLIRFVVVNLDHDPGMIAHLMQSWVFTRSLRIKPTCKSRYLTGIIREHIAEEARTWTPITHAYEYRVLKRQ
jgi:hypothetical protein